MNRDLQKAIWVSTVGIVIFGLMAVYSASYSNARVSHEIFYDQLICAVLGFVMMYGLGKMDYRRFYDMAYPFYIFNILLLLAVLLSSRYILGARRWIEMGGINFQPSEFMKLSVILMLGRYFANRPPRLSFSFFTKAQIILRDLIFPFILVGIPIVLIFKQPDLGTAIMIFGIFLGMLFVSELELKYFMGFLFACLSLVPLGWHILKDYQKDRLLVFLNPNIDPLGAGYTIIQSKIAIGSGQILGKGWLSGTQNQLNFLPERHTDFIFSVIGEEWGLLGALILIGLYGVLIFCGLTIANQIRDRFGTFVTIGIVMILALQVIINIGMAMGLFPIVGLTLPLISYGRSSLLTFLVMIGFLLNLSQRRTVF